MSFKEFQILFTSIYNKENNQLVATIVSLLKFQY
jgi:hypothetical protein